MLFPLFDEGLMPGRFEIAEEILNLLALVTFKSVSFPKAFWKYYERIYQCFCGG